MGLRFFPVVGWAERGDGDATGHGNSVPRFHIAWGAGPGVLQPFEQRAKEAAGRGRLTFRFRHRVDALSVTNGAVDGVSGSILAPNAAPRGKSSNREVVGEFALGAQAVIIASGGIGGNGELVRKNWPQRLGQPPRHMLCGVPDHVDGRMIAIAQRAGARLIHPDRMWHYVEGLQNWDAIWPNHGIRILPGPSSMWFDATGERLPPPLYPGYDTLGTLAHIMRSGYDYSWFVLTQSILRKEFALSGSEQNPDLTGRSWTLTARRAIGTNAPAPVDAFKRRGADFVVRDTLDELVAGMNALAGAPLLEVARLRRQIEARDRQFDNPFAKDAQILGVHNARRYFGDRIARVASPHRILDPRHGPLIAVRLNILTRKTLGGLETDLEARALGENRKIVPGLYAVGEVAGFGGGGMHGYRALEGTFLGGCLFSGRVAGRAAAAAVA